MQLSEIFTGEIYCASCYGKNFGPKGYGFGGGAGTLSMDSGRDSTGNTKWAATQPSSEYNTSSSAGGGPKCPRCGGTVYAAEQLLGAGGSWHKRCFKCKECQKKLDSTTATDNEGEIYCRACYGKNFGPKGFGYGVGSGALTHAE